MNGHAPTLLDPGPLCVSGYIVPCSWGQTDTGRGRWRCQELADGEGVSILGPPLLGCAAPSVRLIIGKLEATSQGPSCD